MKFLQAIDELSLRSLSKLVQPLQHLIERQLWAKIVVGMLFGAGLGVLLGPSFGWIEPATATLLGDWIALPGKIFLGMIQMIVVPLVFASIVRGLAASEGIEQFRMLGWRLTLYFLATTTVAVSIGLVVGLLVNPGEGLDAASMVGLPDPNLSKAAADLQSGSVPQMLTSLLPTNPLGSMVESEMLQVVVFAIFFGVALISMKPEESKPLLSLFGSLQEVCLTLVRWAMVLAPVAVFGLLARMTMTMGLDALVGMAIYVVTVLGALLVLLLFYLVMVAFLARRSPLKFLAGIKDVMLLAFSTSSSAAVMPLSIQTAEEKLGVRSSIAEFTIPIGATVNMDGTAVYQAVATVFLAQATGVDLSMGALALVVVTTVGASIGSPSTPGVGIVLLAGVLTSVGIPVEAVGLIIGVDRILDMSRTAVNVAGDLTACVVMDRWVGSSVSPVQEKLHRAEDDERREETGDDVLIAE